MERNSNKLEMKKLMKYKRLLFASFLIAWAAALQGHMMWLQRQDAYKQKFRTINQEEDQNSGSKAIDDWLSEV